MFDLVRIFVTGLIISLLGGLPLGSLNITAMQLSVEETSREAVKYAIGVALVEIIYVRISLKGMDWVMENQSLFNILEWCTVFLFLILGASSFIAARKAGTGQKNLILKSGINRFLLGVTMSALNPVQIPFWFIWSTYLLSNHFLESTTWDFNLYTVGIGFGTMLGLGIFIFAGKWIVEKLNASHRAINYTVGVIFFISAVIQFYRVMYKPFNQQLKGKTEVTAPKKGT
jgi:threonine/homoserine/homoserine lactone efflux protein